MFCSQKQTHLNQQKNKKSHSKWQIDCTWFELIKCNWTSFQIFANIFLLKIKNHVFFKPPFFVFQQFQFKNQAMTKFLSNCKFFKVTKCFWVNLKIWIQTKNKTKIEIKNVREKCFAKNDWKESNDFEKTFKKIDCLKWDH